MKILINRDLLFNLNNISRASRQTSVPVLTGLKSRRGNAVYLTASNNEISIRRSLGQKRLQIEKTEPLKLEIFIEIVKKIEARNRYFNV